MTNIVLGVIIVILLIFGYYRGRGAGGVIDPEKIGQLEEAIFRMESDIKGSVNAAKTDIQ